MTDADPEESRRLRAENEELRREIERLQRQRRYGLVWEDDREETREQLQDTASQRFPLLVEEPELAIGSASRPHLLLEGDNYLSLLNLTYTHRGKVDLIYIDPPYNTGKQNDFRYNDRFVGEDDTFRHSKWLSFMAPRLRLAWDLLRDDGAILISIDDHEFATLRLLCDQLFGTPKFVGVFVWKKKAKGSHLSRRLVRMHEYVLAYAKDPTTLVLKGERTLGAQRQPIVKRANRIAERTFPAGTVFTDLPDGTHTAFPRGGDLSIDLLCPISVADGVVVSNIFARGHFVWSQEMIDGQLREGSHFRLSSRGNPSVLKHDQGTRFKAPHSLLNPEVVGTNENGSKQLAALMGGDRAAFAYPKPVSLLSFLIQTFLHTKNSATILDFFAGSGSTGQAVLELNSEHGTTHQAILCTNNENGICREVTWERMRRLITGDRPDFPGKALGGGLRFFDAEQSWIDRSETADAMRRAFRTRSVDLLRIRENCFDEIVRRRDYAIFSDGERLLALLFRERSRLPLIDALQAIPGDQPVALYAFSLDGSVDSTPFQAALGERLTLQTVPDELLQTYERIFHQRLFGGWA